MGSVAGEACLPLACYLTRQFGALTQVGITVEFRLPSQAKRKVILERGIVTGSGYERLMTKLLSQP